MLVAVSYPFPYYEELESGIHKRMGKADFGTIDGAIAGCFDNSEKICVLRIEHYLANRILNLIESVNCFKFLLIGAYLDNIKIRHCAEFCLGNPVRGPKGKCRGSEEHRMLPPNLHEYVKEVRSAIWKFLK